MQFGLAFTFPFQDTDWVKKILLMAVISIIPIVGQFVLLGWVIEICRRVIANEQPTLPDAIDFGKWLVKGLLGAVIGFVYVLPLLVIYGCMFVVMFLVPTIITDSNTAGILVSVVSICGGCLILLLAITVGIIMPAALANFAVEGQIGAGFRLGEIFGLVRAAPGAYLLVLVGGLLEGIVGGLGGIVCCIGMFAIHAEKRQRHERWE
jgi:hypothetical protein